LMADGLRQPGFSDRPIARQTARTTAIVAGVFSIVFLVLLVGNFIGIAVIGPRHEDRLAAMIVRFRAEPANEQLQSEIRQMDLSIRKARIWRLSFAEHCSYALLLSVVVLLIAAKSGSAAQGKRSRPGPRQDTGPRQVREASVSRWAVVAAVVVTAAAGWGWLECYGPLAFVHVESGAPSYASDAEKSLQWPRFRGPGGSGVSRFDNIPAQWNGVSGQGILWKSPVPLPGHNSPVVWDKRIFVSGATADKREVYCFDADSGQLLWTGDVPTSPAAAGKKLEEDTGYAASSMATDGRRVYAIFPMGDVAAFDLAGRRLWYRSLGVPDNPYGYASSLETFQDRVIVQDDQGDPESGKARLYALDGSTGRTVWEAKRDVYSSWSSPIVADIAGRQQLIAAANPWLIAYDPAGGTEIWRAKCLGSDVAPSPIYAGGLVLAIEPSGHLVAVKPDGQGDVTATHIAWKMTESGPEICSPVANDRFVYLLEGSGTLVCCSLAEGKKLYDQDLKGMFLASPSLAGNKLYVLSEEGVMHIVEVGALFKEIDKCELGEKTRASPAFASGRIYIRGEKNLYCIGGKP
jgi:outer membrane protein assembly factor BamB